MSYDIIHISGKPHFLVPVHEFTELQQSKPQDLPKDVAEAIALGKDSAIKIIRKFRKMTQDDLAREAGISRPYLTEIETGRKDGSIRALKNIAKALAVSLDAIT